MDNQIDNEVKKDISSLVHNEDDIINLYAQDDKSTSSNDDMDPADNSNNTSSPNPDSSNNSIKKVNESQPTKKRKSKHILLITTIIISIIIILVALYIRYSPSSNNNPTTNSTPTPTPSNTPNSSNNKLKPSPTITHRVVIPKKPKQFALFSYNYTNNITYTYNGLASNLKSIANLASMNYYEQGYIDNNDSMFLISSKVQSPNGISFGSSEINNYYYHDSKLYLYKNKKWNLKTTNSSSSFTSLINQLSFAPLLLTNKTEFLPNTFKTSDSSKINSTLKSFSLSLISSILSAFEETSQPEADITSLSIETIRDKIGLIKSIRINLTSVIPPKYMNNTDIKNSMKSSFTMKSMIKINYFDIGEKRALNSN